jgi:hypothetical protein
MAMCLFMLSTYIRSTPTQAEGKFMRQKLTETQHHAIDKRQYKINSSSS